MPRSRAPLAKLTRPRLHAPVPRERLFRLLDELRARPVVWIEGPPGAGKSTLAATYLDEARLPGIWYQLDGGDSDPATFFYYLREATQPYSGRRRPLPLLTPEYLEDLPGFARRFFRAFFEVLPPGAVVVFDNYQEVLLASRLHEMLSSLADETPQSANVIVISRTPPPQQLARALVSDKVRRVGWDDLRLSYQETVRVAASHGVTDDGVARVLYDRSNGWAAGVTLLLERLRRDGAVYTSGQEASSGAAFDYFASQIFDPAPIETRALLMNAALLPRITLPLLEALSGSPDAGQVLESVYQRHLFLDRRPGHPPSYHLHALFSEFLQHRALRDLGADGVRALRQRAAELLVRFGQHEEAIPLLLDCEDWGQAEALLIRAAPALIGQGRWQTLQDWGRALPGRRVDECPELQYWIGRSNITVDPEAAKRELETAYTRFQSLGDQTGALLAAAGVVDALFFEFSNFRAMEPWIARVVSLLEQGVRPSTKEDELRVHAAVLVGATYRAPQHSMVETCVRRVETLLCEPFDPNLKVTVASMLHAFGNMAVDFEAEEIGVRVARPLLGSPELTGWTAAFYLAHEGYTHYIHSRYSEGLACFDQADRIAADHSLKDLRVVAGNWRGLCERRAGLIDKAEATVSRIETLGPPARSYALAVFQLLRGSVAFARNDLAGASSTVRAAYWLSYERGQFNGSMLIGMVAANFAIAAGETDTASSLLSHLLAQAEGTFAENYLGAIVLNQAWLELRQRNLSCSLALLKQSLERARDLRQRFRYRWYTNALSELLPVALHHDIEPDVASQLVVEYGIVPLGAPPQNWPWPIKIHALGRFHLTVGDHAPRFSRKTPRKVLLLLKALIAFGVAEVPEEKVIDALWPDEDGDAAHRALTATVHRLRLLLADPAVLRQRGGTLSLDGTKCWVDVQAFESLLSEGTTCARREAIALYGGAFLSQDADASWAIPRRERLRAKFTEAIDKQAAELEQVGDLEAAAACYARGLEADDLVESFYQGLMRCYRALDRRDAALGVYRRCREVLAARLGDLPSSATERLLQALRVNPSASPASDKK